MQQELLFVGPGQGVDVLLVLAGAQGGDHDRLGLAAGEQGRAVGAREDADFRDDVADLVEGAAVDAVAVVDDVATQDVGFTFLEGRAELGGIDTVRIFVGLHQLGGGGLLGHVDAVAALVFAGVGVGLLDVLADQLLDGGDDVRVILGLEVEGLLGGVLGHFDDGVDHRLHAAMREHQGVEHDVFRQLLGFGFDHHQGVLGAGDDEVELAVRHLVEGRVQNVFAVDIADARGADRAHERSARDGQGGRGGDHGDDVGIVLQVMRQHRGHDLHFVLEALHEQRADRTVDQAGDQGLLLGRTAFTLEIATRDLAGGEGLFLVVHGQREEIQARLGRATVDDGGEDDGLAVGGQNGAVSLTGDAARFEGQRASGPVDRLAFDIEHVRLSYPAGGFRAGSHQWVERRAFSPSVHGSCAPSRTIREEEDRYGPRVMHRYEPRRAAGLWMRKEARTWPAPQISSAFRA